VILGFTSGIGIVIALSQIKDFFGLQGDVPGEFIHKMEALWAIRGTFNVWAFALACLTLLIISVMKAWRPTWPGLLVAVVVASAVAFVFGLPVETIGSRFGGIPRSLPTPALPDLSPDTVRTLLPSIMTIAFLIGIESLLSAVAADAKTGGRHRSNIEVVAQGVANVASPLFGGLPATGVIARTGTNITAGAKTPVAGILHAGFVLLFMLLLAPLASYLILPCLAAVLINVAWRLIDWREVSHFMMRAPVDDRVVLGVTLLLTVLVDLTVAISVGVVLACILFMHRMAVASGNGLAASIDDSDLDDVRGPRSAIAEMSLPDEIAVFHLRGPLFFGGAGAIRDALATRTTFPRVLILRLRDVPHVDATALSALEDVAMDCDSHGCRIILVGLQKQPRIALHKLGLPRRHRMLLASNSFIALEKAKALLA
jgi:SulP family sulfate permease